MIHQHGIQIPIRLSSRGVRFDVAVLFSIWKALLGENRGQRMSR
jgi:hypothetical protein